MQHKPILLSMLLAASASLVLSGCVVAPRRRAVAVAPARGCVWVSGHWNGRDRDTWIRPHWRCP